MDAAIVAQPMGDEPAKLLLIQRKHPPCQGMWALPGGFVDENEPLDAAAARELQEETSVNPQDVLLKQVGAFGDPGRDPRGWCVTVAYVALVPTQALGVRAADDAADAQWHAITHLPALAFDHQLVVRDCLRSLAAEPRACAVDGLVDMLQAAAQSLEGPWVPPKE